MEDCIFCKIIAGQIPADKVYEDDEVLAFKDINPATPIHILVVPKRHIEKLTDMKDGDEALVGKIFQKINLIAKEQGFFEDGFRVIVNCGENSGQEVMHLHFHVLAGTKLGPKIVNCSK